ncbi:MAG: beta-ketoacyl synthase N-terminal-like domain-containing protein, partial [Bacteroidota bacterium]
MKDYTGFEIAVIGMCGRFPGAGDVQTFWKNLAEGKESITFLSDEELLSEGESQRNLDNPRYVRANSFIEDKGYFDSNFFGYLPIEARLMDPQMRILHECVWKVIEDAGYDLERVKERIGLFTGAKA